VERDRLTQQLRQELTQLEVEAIWSTVAAPPPGAKAAGAAELGQLGLILLPIVVPKLIDLLQAWALRHKDRSVSIKTPAFQIEFPPGGMAPADLAALVERVAASSTAPARPSSESLPKG
jgi:hypothetical protein